MAAVFRAFEAAKASLGVETYTLTQTTLEAVFLDIVARAEADCTPAAPTGE